MALAPLLFAAAACGGAPAPAAPGPSKAQYTVKPNTTLRPGLGVTDCGTFTLAQGEQLPDQAARCFADEAGAGHRALLKVTRPTVEGAPIHVTYTSGDDGRTEVVTDSRADNFGPKEVTTEDCQGPEPGPYGIEFTSCVRVTK
ncbi:MAG: DUF4362 domain-containing protein [Actinomycetota bacterium]|nr:DUF4362 domain-containing protein [Actinomycetota bacterium]